VATLRIVLVSLEAPLRVWLEIDRPPMLDKPMVQIDAIYRALADAPLRVDRIGAKIVALDWPLGDELRQLVGSLATACVQVAVFIEAVLIRLGCINAIEAKGLAVELDCVGVLCVTSITTDGKQENKKDRNSKVTHRHGFGGGSEVAVRFETYLSPIPG
jgi:hypothetical protein